ncbi:antA/AntB antirepressor family protein [Elizabethkingia anophelis]|nr:antA/AntB antirepressor family protein [Elizabethkingia anophelis]MCT3682078.1 antA/AntB antirepressor family protein [Elizabethkingia anophelis]
MNELIKITEQNGNSAVSARELHTFLESKQEFSTWIKNRIKKYGFIENQDFEVFDNFIKNSNGGRPLLEYALTIDCAKEIAMVEGNEKGKQARQYFISFEKNHKTNIAAYQNDPFIQLRMNQIEQQKKIDDLDNKVKLIEAKTTTRPNYFTVVGYATLNKIECGLKLASSIGRKASKLCKDRNIPMETIPDPRFGEVKTYPYDILDEVFSSNLVLS